jgi:carboxyl-terminal processing protease
LASEKPGRSVFTRNRGIVGIRSAPVTFLLLVSCASVLVALCWFGGYSCSAQPGKAAITRTAATRAPASAAAQQVPSQTDTVVAACRLIYHGRFAEAEKLTEQVGLTDKAWAHQLRGIIQRYEEIGGHRKVERQAAYKKQLDELNELKSSGVLERPDRAVLVTWEADEAATPGPRDANEPNDIPDVLAVIARASEIADSGQKKELFADPFVAGVIQAAIDRSAALEVAGKWLDAYTRYYYWLQAIDPNNKGYETHAEELLDRAGIAASFQDSPCESRKERYEGVERRMLERAVEALSLHYVNSIDYAQMATKAVRRCELLAEVLVVAFAEGTEAGSENSLQAPAPDKTAAWSSALAGLRDEIERSAEKFGKSEFLEILDNVLALNKTTVDLPQQPLVAHFTEAALAVLDPYTVMVWPRQVQDFEKLMTNEFTGIGIEISKPKGLLTVASLLPDTPAYRAGLDAGDVIEAVDGVPTKDMSLMCAVKKITGPKGTKVVLTLRRQGKQDTETMMLTRDRIIVPTIRGWQRTEDGDWLYMLDEAEKIGYVRITSFSGETASDLEDVLHELEANGLRGLIMDLRFNTGGLLDSAVEITDKFVSEGLIVRTQPKANMIPSFEHAHPRGTHPDYPLVVLINSGSASASEIVAGALADEKHERAILVGTRTHGKGSVQGITHYPGGGAQLKYTMAYYHLPSGQRVQSRDAVEKEGRKDWGVGADVEVNLTGDELKAMLDVQRDNDVLVQAHRDGSKPALNKHKAEETLRADPQLAVGLLVAKTKLIEAGRRTTNQMTARSLGE